MQRVSERRANEKQGEQTIKQIPRSDRFFFLKNMQIKLFTIPIFNNEEMLAEMNKFLACNKILEIDQHFSNIEKGGYWKVDYKQKLNDSEFKVFSILRECRKILASEDTVPAYAVFTDEELAYISQRPSIEAQKLISIKGIGDKKVEKYGKKLIELYQACVLTTNISIIVSKVVTV